VLHSYITEEVVTAFKKQLPLRARCWS